MCDKKVSASIDTTPKAHTVTWISNWKRHLAVFILIFWNWCKREIMLRLEHQQHQILKLWAPKRNLLRYNNTAKLVASDKVTITMTPDAFWKNSVDITVLSGISLILFSQPEVLALIGELARKLRVSLNRDNYKETSTWRIWNPKGTVEKQAKQQICFN